MDSGLPLCLFVFIRIILIATTASTLNLEAELFQDLMKDYNKNVRPMESSGDITKVHIKMTLTNLISLNEKEEALTTSVWIEMQWCDYRLRWNQMPRSALYGNITSELRMPSQSIWLPDIILENKHTTQQCALAGITGVDGQFEVALYCNALVSPDGCVYWLPPAIYRSACPITVNYFPFDWQNCSMVFRSQTYSANEIEIVLKEEDNYTLEWVDIDPEAFTENGEWVIKHRPAKKLINPQYTKEDLEYQEVVFFLIIQRKPLFYIINLIAPCVLFSSLGLLVYYLPAKGCCVKFVFFEHSDFLTLFKDMQVLGKCVHIKSIKRAEKEGKLLVVETPNKNNVIYHKYAYHYSRGSEVLYVHCHSPGPNCFRVADCEKGTRDVTSCPFDWEISDVCDVSDNYGSDELCDSPKCLPKNTKHSQNDRQSAKGETVAKASHFVLLNTLPRLLRMQMQPWTPKQDIISENGNGHAADSAYMPHCRRRSSMTLITKAEEYVLRISRSELMFKRLRERNGLMKSVLDRLHNGLGGGTAEHLCASLANAAVELRQCVASCKHIAATAKQKNIFQNENEEWFLVARVIDRACFIVMALVFWIGTVAIFLMGHFNKAPSSPFPGDPKTYLPPTQNLTESGTGFDFLV